MNLIVHGIALMAVSASAAAAQITISKADQAAIVKEARHQKEIARLAELDFRAGATTERYGYDLLRQMDAWEGVQATDLAKSAFMACAGSVGDLSSLILNQHQRAVGWASFQDQKLRHLEEDKRDCNEALTNPRRAFLSLDGPYHQVTVE